MWVQFIFVVRDHWMVGFDCGSDTNRIRFGFRHKYSGFRDVREICVGKGWIFEVGWGLGWRSKICNWEYCGRVEEGLWLSLPGWLLMLNFGQTNNDILRPSGDWLLLFQWCDHWQNIRDAGVLGMRIDGSKFRTSWRKFLCEGLRFGINLKGWEINMLSKVESV